MAGGLCAVCGGKGAHIRTFPVYRLGEPVVLCGPCQAERRDNPYYLDPSPEAAVTAHMGDKKQMRPAKCGVILDRRTALLRDWRGGGGRG